MKCHVFQLVLLCYSIIFSFIWASFLENVLLTWWALLHSKSLKNAHFSQLAFSVSGCALYQKFKQFIWHNNYADGKISVLDLYKCCEVLICFFSFFSLFFFFFFFIPLLLCMEIHADLVNNVYPLDNCFPKQLKAVFLQNTFFFFFVCGT